MELQAWSNGYEVVAARSEDEARNVCGEWLTANRMDDDEDTIDGDGWRALDPSRVVKDDDGSEVGTVASIVAEADFPRHLWSVEQ